MNKLSFFLPVALLLIFSACGNETVAPEKQLDDDDSVSFFDPKTQELIHLDNLDELKTLIKDRYAKHEKLDQLIEGIDAFKFELDYSRTLDLTDPAIAGDYESYLQEKYESRAKIGPGQLKDNGNFLAATSIPMNLRRNRRNRADSFQSFTFSGNFFCDRTWFRSPRIYILGAYGVETQFNSYGFNNRTESMF